MSTKAIKESLDLLAQWYPVAPPSLIKAREELERIKQAAVDLTRLNVGDHVYSVRDRAAEDPTFTGNTWEHPDVTAWSNAATTLAAIARQKESK